MAAPINQVKEITQQDFDNLTAELKDLEEVKLKEAAARIAEARSHGDLSENAEYDAAMDDQGKIAARIKVVKALLANSKIIDESENNDNLVHLMSKVTVEMLKTGAQAVYTIVGSGSTKINPREGFISDESPVGKALIKKAVGDVVEVETPGGTLPLKVIDISK